MTDNMSVEEVNLSGNKQEAGSDTHSSYLITVMDDKIRTAKTAANTLNCMT